MKILVTGASGFIGKELIKKLQDDHLLSLFVHGNKDIDGDNFEDIFRGDVTKKNHIKGITEDIDIIIHLAGSTERQNNKTYKDNVIGTKNLLEESRNTKIKKFIFLSTLSVYDLPLFRKKNKNKLKIEDIYEESKIKAERLVKNYSEKNNFEYAIIRPGMVFDLNEPNKEIKWMDRFVRLRIVPLLSKGKNLINIVSRRKLNTEILNIIDEDKQGLFVIDGNELTYREVLNKLSKFRDKEYIPVEIPYSFLEKFIFFMEKISSLPGITLPISEAQLKNMKKSQVY